jgi:hypothetical protein
MVGRSEVFLSEDARRLQIQGPKRCTTWTEDMAVWNQRYPEGNPWRYSGIREFRRDSHAHFASFAVTVQQPCSNLARMEPNRTENKACQDCQKPRRYVEFSDKIVRARSALAALAWRRSGVRVPSGPLPFSFYLQVKRDRS